MSSFVRPIAWYEAAGFGFAWPGAARRPRPSVPWPPEEMPKRGALAIVVQTLKGAILGVHGASRRQGA
jgi:hypothetical protein